MATDHRDVLAKALELDVSKGRILAIADAIVAERDAYREALRALVGANVTPPADDQSKRDRVNLPGLLGAMKRRHAGERSALRARQRLEVRAMRRR